MVAAVKDISIWKWKQSKRQKENIAAYQDSASAYLKIELKKINQNYQKPEELHFKHEIFFVCTFEKPKALNSPLDFNNFQYSPPKWGILWSSVPST